MAAYANLAAEFENVGRGLCRFRISVEIGPIPRELVGALIEKFVRHEALHDRVVVLVVSKKRFSEPGAVIDDVGRSVEDLRFSHELGHVFIQRKYGQLVLVAAEAINHVR